MSAQTTREHPPSHAPLTGMHVVDFSRYLPGPFASLQLAWLGARVTCVEQPPAGDPMRHMAPLDDTGTSLASHSLRRNMQQVLIDLRTDDGRDHALALCDGADVVLESFRPGVASSLGIGAEQVRARAPHVVYCSLSGYGQDGPWRDVPGHDVNYEALAGLLDAASPALPQVPIADVCGGLSAAVAVCAALARRAVSGDGCTIDVSLTEAALSLQAMQLPGSTARPGGAHGAGLLRGELASYGVYRCADGEHVAVGPIEPKFFHQLCEALGEPDLTDLQYDPASQPAIREALTRAFAVRTAREWEDRVGHLACVTRIPAPHELGEHPQLLARGATDEVRVPGSGQARMPGAPWVIDGARPRTNSDAHAPKTS